MPDEVIVAPAPDTGNPAPDTKTKGEAKPAPAADPASAAPTAADAPAEVKPDWSEDWRAKLAAGDEKFLKRLERMQSPVDLAKSYRALEQKMSSGEMKAKLAENATPEEVAAYRKDNGIPDKPEGYLDNLPNGLVLGDDDKPMALSFAEKALAANAPPEFVKMGLDWYQGLKEQAVADQAEADKAFRTASADALRAEWGAEYRANFNAAMAFLDTAPPTDDGKPFKDLLLGARMADGTLLGDNPAALKWLTGLAAEANPAGFISPGSGMGQLDGVQTEIESIRKTMRENRAAYDKDEKMQARFLKLLDAEAKLKQS